MKKRRLNPFDIITLIYQSATLLFLFICIYSYINSWGTGSLKISFVGIAFLFICSIPGLVCGVIIGFLGLLGRMHIKTFFINLSLLATNITLLIVLFSLNWILKLLQ